MIDIIIAITVLASLCFSMNWLMQTYGVGSLTPHKWKLYGLDSLALAIGLGVIGYILDWIGK